MKAVVQRVIDATVTVNGVLKGGVHHGLLVYLGVARDDTPHDADWLTEKIANLRIFDDSEGKMNLSLVDIVHNVHLTEAQRHGEGEGGEEKNGVNLCNMKVNDVCVNRKCGEVNVINLKPQKPFVPRTEGSTCLGESLFDVPIGVLAVSQFTLLGDARKGRRPTWEKAAPPEKARELYLYFIEKMGEKVPCSSGEFQAHMKVAYTNDGPVTILLDSR